MNCAHRLGRTRRGFSLLFVLTIGILLVALAGSLFVLSNSQARRSLAERERLTAEVMAENGLSHLIADQRGALLNLGQDGDNPPDRAEDPYLFVLEDQFYFGANLVDGSLDDYLDDRPLATNFAAARDWVREGSVSQQWWLYSLGGVQWRPLDFAELTRRQGIFRIADREMVVVGEALGSSGSVLQRQVRGRNLGFYIDLNDPLVTLRPETAVALVPVSGYAPTPNPRAPQAVFTLNSSLSISSPLSFQGALLVDDQGEDVAALKALGQSRVTFVPDADPQTANKTLYPTLTKPNTGLWLMGKGTLDKPVQVELDTQAQSLNPERRATLQLDIPLAMALGRQGTTFEGEFKDSEDITNDQGERIYEAQTHHFDLGKARNGILWITQKRLALAAEQQSGSNFTNFTYSGRGTIVITAADGFTLQNSSLLPSPEDPEASLTLIVAPEPQTPTVPLPPGASLLVPPAVQLNFGSPVVPQTVLADEEDHLLTFDCSVNARPLRANQDPLVTNDPKVKRTIGFFTLGRFSIPAGTRAYALDDKTCAILARDNDGQTEIILSLGIPTQQPGQAQQLGRIQARTIPKARSIPLQRIQANIFSMNPVQIRSSNRVIGQLVAPRLRVSAGVASSLYGVDHKDRFQVDFIHRTLPPTLGSWLMTFRANLTPRPVPLPVTYLESRQWRPLPASVLTATGEQLTAPTPSRPPALPTLALASSPNQVPSSPPEEPPSSDEQEAPDNPPPASPPPQIPAVPPPSPPVPPLQPLPDRSAPNTAPRFQLGSIARMGKRFLAQLTVIRGTTAETVEVEIGSTIAGWRVSQITDTQVVLTRNKERQILTL
ncbi:hypothetical protein [Anthocerotibacter panamensis]|uniref:hypothetical protein n=1 Tax=Anthocerotibacter panamensis TaxID=2857077 RepID=UPI001C404FA8|nr:hypothetical protein [Anthocerotibacter panamensis]